MGGLRISTELEGGTRNREPEKKNGKKKSGRGGGVVPRCRQKGTSGEPDNGCGGAVGLIKKKAESGLTTLVANENGRKKKVR